MAFLVTLKQRSFWSYVYQSIRCRTKSSNLSIECIQSPMLLMCIYRVALFRTMKSSGRFMVWFSVFCRRPWLVRLNACLESSQRASVSCYSSLYFFYWTKINLTRLAYGLGNQLKSIGWARSVIIAWKNAFACIRSETLSALSTPDIHLSRQHTTKLPRRKHNLRSRVEASFKVSLE